MHNRSDQFTKSLLRDGLSLASAAETEVEVLAATQKIDVYSVPDPARESERAAMGLLGELSAEPSLLEPFHGTPSLRQVRHCLRKQLTWHHELERRVRSAAALRRAGRGHRHATATGGRLPALVVIGPGRPETVLDAYRCEPVQAGVYHGRAGPGDARGGARGAAPDAYNAAAAAARLGPPLAAKRWRIWRRCPAMPGRRASPCRCCYTSGSEYQEPTTDEEDDVSAADPGLVRGVQAAAPRAEGRKEGRAEEAARAVLTALRVRGIAVPDIARERILTEKDPGAPGTVA